MEPWLFAGAGAIFGYCIGGWQFALIGGILGYVMLIGATALLDQSGAGDFEEYGPPLPDDMDGFGNPR